MNTRYKIIITIFLIFLGFRAMANDFQSIDPSTILYSTPTIPNQLPPLVAPKENENEKIYPIHEDDWSNIEFLKKSQLSKLKQELKKYSEFEASNRKEMGWQNVYLRHIEHDSLFNAIRPKQKLLKLLSAKEGNAPIIHSTGSISGFVKNGFTIDLGKGVMLYGYTEGMSVKELGASLGENPDSQTLVSAFVLLNREFDLVLVDWVSQFILTGFSDSGQIETWQP